jgi:phosphoenolpyruvate carboxykinase (ATP)
VATRTFYLPAQGDLMHCPPMSAIDTWHCSSPPARQDHAVYRSNRILIGDDEQWGSDGVFNSRAAATPNASSCRPRPPEIYSATNRFGAVLENVKPDPATRVCDFDNDSKLRTPARLLARVHAVASRTAALAIRRTSSSSPPTPSARDAADAKLTPAQAM